MSIQRRLDILEKEHRGLKKDFDRLLKMLIKHFRIMRTKGGHI